MRELYYNINSRSAADEDWEGKGWELILARAQQFPSIYKSISKHLGSTHYINDGNNINTIKWRMKARCNGLALN